MSEVLQLTLGRIATPIGEMEIVTDDEGNLRVVDWTDYDSRMHRLLRRYYGEGAFKLAIGRNPEHVTDAIEKYFAGELHAIDNLAVQTGGTTFQREVWSALRKIPCGTTVSYATIAQRIGRESAVRAVGLANGANPIGVVVPCHRVIGADGSLTGYGGGLERKRWLLEHESRPSRTLFPGPARDVTKGPVLTSAIVES